MAIGYARLEFVKRSDGKNACCKSAYNSRSTVKFQGHEHSPEKTYNWSQKSSPAYHDILLPNHVDVSFKNTSILWNAVEQKENRKNSQVCMELVLALPDDKVVSLNDKIELTKTFVQKHFIDKGLAAQIDIHAPEKLINFNPEIGEIENLGHNWHAHVLITTRRFSEDGKELGEKARDLMPEMRLGYVTAGKSWGKNWTEHQNLFFEDKGISLRVDPNGLISQIHLGPVRMRGRAYNLINENNIRMELNIEEVQDPKKLLQAITQENNIFSKENLENMLEKYVDTSLHENLKKEFWSQKEIVSLSDYEGRFTGKFTTKEILSEEKKCLQLADSIVDKKSFELEFNFGQFSENLTEEQKLAYQNILNGKRLSCIGGHAGTGKSHLLVALKSTYEFEGYVVRAFGPDTATSNVLNEKGFSYAENLHRFLFGLNNGKRTITSGKEVWIVDEASKLGNRLIAQLLKSAKKYDAQLIFSGDQSQMKAIDRGCLYKALCEKYGSQDLVEIQRQAKEVDRNISKNIANGKISVAIDDIIRSGGIIWDDTRKDSIERLIKHWAADKEAFPDKSSLIIANSRVERKVLNEMVRLYRKEKGEISKTEFECRVGDRKIFVSVGDLIEFHKNDKTLGVTNGMTGILVEASSDKFIVSINEGDKPRNVIFNPTEYSSYQLGYATTYYRSQGKTIDRAYVLHSPQLNKESFYVGLTRHVNKAFLYVPKDNMHYLSFLKAKACGFDSSYQDFLKNKTYFSTKSTDEYTSALKEQVSGTNQGEMTTDYQTFREVQISELKNSNSLFSKIKGHALSTWDQVAGLISDRKYAKRADFEFYHPLVKQEEKASVKEIQIDCEDDILEDVDLSLVSKVINAHSVLNEKLISAGSSETTSWNNFSQEKQNLLKSYFEANENAHSYYTIIKTDSENEMKFSPHFKEWMNACNLRNELAYKITRSLSKKELSSLLGERGSAILWEKSNKHEIYIDRKANKEPNIESLLKENIESLLSSLFPDGPTRREKNSLRFGSNGSLVVGCTGENKGVFYDHENSVGGGPLGLIQKKLGISLDQAREWAKEFLGQSSSLTLPSYSTKKFEMSDDWVSLKPDPAIPAPSLREISRGLDRSHQEVARHPYYNEKGELLFYVLRLVENNHSAKKKILPLSYGRHVGEEGLKWSLRGYKAQERPLYNLLEIIKHSKNTVLIVEGEKTVEAANKLFVNDRIISTTWLGGAGAVSKTDWSHLYGRQVIIWPDNDEAGFKAAEQISTELRKIGVRSLHVVDSDILRRELPSKWDLADPLPKNKPQSFIKDLLFSAKEKSIGIDQLVLGMTEKGNPEIEKLRVNDILWRLEERLREKMEKNIKPWEVNTKIQDDLMKILNDQKNLSSQFQDKLGVSEEISKKLAYQVSIFKAEKGISPSLSTIKEMKEIIAKFSYEKNKNTSKEAFDYSLDKTFYSIINFGIREKYLIKNLEKSIERQINDFSIQLAKNSEIQRVCENQREY